MKEFGFYLKEKMVKKISEDYETASSLINDAKERVGKAEKLNIKEFKKIIFENFYDALREILDAILAIRGFKSYSHEASISFLKELKFEDSVISELDEFRFKRNSSKYYGRGISEHSVNEIINFYKRHASSLIQLCKKEDNSAKK